MAGNTKIVPIKPYSDGDSNHIPKSTEWKITDPSIYLEKLAAQWMEASGESRYGVNYKLDRLPHGYRLYERPRPKDAKIIDKHLYGHPQHKFFDSPNRFYKHFEHLMNNHSSVGCPCTICDSKKTIPLPMKSRASVVGPGRGGAKAKFKTVGAPDSTRNPRLNDEERTPDMLRRLLDRLRRNGSVDQQLNETLSMDWRSEREQLPRMLETLPKQRSWIPRVGEIVLFARDLDGEICYDEGSKSYRVFSEEQQIFVGSPKWEAAVVGQVPVESIHIQDVLQEGTKVQNVTYSGFRVEPYPDPNGKDKRFTKQYKYVPLHHLRPFIFWQELLKGIPDAEWHQTILNALIVASSFSLVEKYHFKGQWPQANVLCKGLFIGSELICVGDAVRILPSTDTNEEVTDILHVQSIRLKITNLDKASDDDNDDGHPYNSTVLLAGKAYTTKQARAWENTGPISSEVCQKLPNGMQGYKDWFYLHSPNKQYQISFTKVMGRCFEAETMQLCFPSSSNESPSSILSIGVSGVRSARAFSSHSDRRIQDGKHWFWGDSRTEVLDIETLNSVDVSAYNEERDDHLLIGWRAVIRVLDKTTGSADDETLRQATLVERPRAPKTMSSSMGKAAFEDDEVIPGIEYQSESSQDPQTDTDIIRRFLPGKKRSRSVADASSDEDSDSESSGGLFFGSNEPKWPPEAGKPVVMVPALQGHGESKKARLMDSSDE